MIAILAKLAGYSRLEALRDWAHLRAADLTIIFGLARPTIPHQSTWSRILGHAVAVQDLEARLTSFFLLHQRSAEQPARGSLTLVLDGKTLRGTIPTGQTRGVHLLAAYLPDIGVMLAQAPVETKENAIVVAPSVLARLPLNGMVVVGAPSTPKAPSAQPVLRPTVITSGLSIRTGRPCWTMCNHCFRHPPWRRAGACPNRLHQRPGL